MKELIESLYLKNVSSIEEKYLKTQESAEGIVEEVIVSTLEDSLLDTSRMSFVEYSKKYIHSSTFFESKDFTASEIKNIISETPLTERDRHIAVMRYVDLKSEEDIADALYVDKKTIHTNLPKISCNLKKTAQKLYSKK